MEGTTDITLGAIALPSIQIGGELNSDLAFTVSGTYLGSIHPLAALGETFDFLEIVEPSITLNANLDALSLGVQIDGALVFDLLDGALTLSVALSGGGTLGFGPPVVWFAGSLIECADNDPDCVPFELPGLGPFPGTVCFAASTGDQPGVELCGETVTLRQGIVLKSTLALPENLGPPDLIALLPAAELTIELKSLSHIKVKGALAFGMEIITPDLGVPTIDSVSFESLFLDLEINGADLSVGFGAEAAFKPSNQDAPIDGTVKMKYTPPTTLGGTMFLNGRWYEPFGLPKIVVANPGVTFDILFAGQFPTPQS